MRSVWLWHNWPDVFSRRPCTPQTSDNITVGSSKVMMMCGFYRPFRGLPFTLLHARVWSWRCSNTNSLGLVLKSVWLAGIIQFAHCLFFLSVGLLTAWCNSWFLSFFFFFFSVLCVLNWIWLLVLADVCDRIFPLKSSDDLGKYKRSWNLDWR